MEGQKGIVGLCHSHELQLQEGARQERLRKNRRHLAGRQEVQLLGSGWEEPSEHGHQAHTFFARLLQKRMTEGSLDQAAILTMTVMVLMHTFPLRTLLSYSDGDSG